MNITIPAITIPDDVIENALRSEMSVAVLTTFDPRASVKVVAIGYLPPLVAAEINAKVLAEGTELEQ